MLRAYLDSNVYRYIKPTHPSYNIELHSLMDSLVDEEILFIYSDAHLNDLSKSAKQYIAEDLKIMETYVKRNFFTRDAIKNVVKSLLLTPTEAYDRVNWDIMHRVFENFDLDEVMYQDLGQEDESDDLDLVKKSIDTIFNVPIGLTGPTIDTSNLEGKHKEWFDRIFPNYSPSMTLKEFMNGAMAYGGSLMNSSSEVTELRNYIEEYMSSDSYNYETWGMEFDLKLKEKFGRSFLELIDNVLPDKQKTDRFIQFYYAYTLLEMYNITREKAGNKTKKFTYWSLYNDALHSYFGSLCDCLVTDDKGLQVKAQILYSLFDIPTEILSTKGFVDLKSEFQSNEKNTQEFLDKILLNLSESYFISIETVIETKEVIANYVLAREHFNVFTHLKRIDYSDGIVRFILTLFKDRTEITLLKSELQLIVKKLINAFGSDFDNKGYLSSDEIIESGLLRHWRSSVSVIQLGLEEKNGSFTIDLYIDIKSNSKGTND